MLAIQGKKEKHYFKALNMEHHWLQESFFYTKWTY
jgi:hypothetical protein